MCNSIPLISYALHADKGIRVWKSVLIAVTVEKFAIHLDGLYNRGISMPDIMFKKIHVEVNNLEFFCLSGIITVVFDHIHSSFFVLAEGAIVFLVGIHLVLPVHLHILTTVDDGVARQMIVH